MRSGVVFILEGGVQMRRERFGLLFYNYRGPRLYFLPTKELMGEHFFYGKQTVGELIESIYAKHGQWPRKMVHEWVNQILKTLKRKGLIREQSIC